MSETAAPDRPERETGHGDAPLQRALAAARIATWERDLQTNRSTWSGFGERLFGLSAGTFDGTYAAFLARVHPDDRARVEEAATRAIDQDGSYDAEFRVCWPDGSVHWLAAHARVVHDAAGRPLRLTGVAHEVTRRTETAPLQRGEERYRTIVQTANEGIWLIDANGRTLYVNERMATMLGHPVADFAERLASDFCFPEDRAWAAERLQRNLKGQSAQFQARFRHREGGEIHTLASTSPVRGADGQVVGALGLFTDVTERERADAERVRLIEQERAARAEAEAAVQARDEFLSIAAHELLTPLTAIKGHTQTLLRAQARGPIEPARLARVLGSLAESCDRLTVLTRDLLDVSRLRTGQLALRRQALDLVLVVRQTVAEYSGQLLTGHVLRVDAPAAPCPLSADRDRIEQVLTNLLGNATKYSPHGSTIDVRMSLADDGALLEVRDAGIGLPPGTTETIFQPFGRAPNATRRQVPGMGLGLYISRQIVEQHGGRMWAASPGEGEGTTVSVWLPTAGEAPPA